MRSSIFQSLCALAALAPSTLAHGGHEDNQIPVAPPDADWATRHMIEEHHITSWDPGYFFTIHDYSNNGFWDGNDIRRTYGLLDPSAAKIPEDQKSGIVTTVLSLYDADQSGTISYAEFVAAYAKGVTLPDFGTGPGHHGDDEYEYEIHHFEKYHGEDATEEELTHPEDIEHFRKHDEMDAAEESWKAKEGKGIVEENIPPKFRRAG